MIGLGFCSVPVSFRIFNVVSQNYRIIQLSHTHRGLALVFLVWCLWSSFQPDTLVFSIIYQSNNVGMLYMLYDCLSIFGQRAGYISVAYLYCELKTPITIITNFLSDHNVHKHATPPKHRSGPQPQLHIAVVVSILNCYQAETHSLCPNPVVIAWGGLPCDL
jgi:hypothetical protein